MSSIFDNGGFIGRTADYPSDGVWNTKTVWQNTFTRDPYWNNVTLLIQATGSNGSQSIVDASNTNRSLTVFGNTAITTSDGPFASDTRSIDFDGTGDYLTTSAFNLSGDFTIEGFIKYDVIGGVMMGNENLAVKNCQALRLEDLGAGSNEHLYYNANPIAQVSGGTHSANVWYHLSVTRSGSTVRVFTDGVQVASGTDSKSFEVAAIGAIDTARNPFAFPFFDGRISELRITNGVARYTSNFTPPTAPFPTQ